MITRLLYIGILSLVVMGVQAQDIRTCSQQEFRKWVKAVVSAGNQHYQNSCRWGIKQMADSIGVLLTERSRMGTLTRMDSLEFTADRYKLLGDFHYENSHYESSSSFYSEHYLLLALSIYTHERAFAYELDKAPMIHRELAQLYYKLHRYKEALYHISMAVDAFTTSFQNEEFEAGDSLYDDYLELQTQQALCYARVGEFQQAFRQIERVLNEYPEHPEYNEALRKKGKIWMLSDSTDAKNRALPLYKKHFHWRKADALQRLSTMNKQEREAYWMRMQPFVADCYQLEEMDPGFLFDVTLFSKGLLLQLDKLSGYGQTSEAALQSLQYTYRQIQQRLPVSSCAIEFVQYEKKGKQCLGALVLKKKGSPQWVNMMSPDEFMNYQIEGRTNQYRIQSVVGKSKNALYLDSAFYHRIWTEDLVKAIGKNQTIYFSPDGYLHQLAMEYMLPSTMETKDLYRLTSTRRLLEDSNVRTDAAMLVGGIRYNGKVDSQIAGNDALAFSFIQSKQADFNYLLGTLTECNTIYSFRSCPKDTLLVGIHGSEQAFRRLCNQYPIINLSTHGFYHAVQTPKGTDIHPCSSDESLSQSILALAGVNVNLQNESFDARVLDGLLSARELSELNMSNVDLVSVSACQTGLGYVTADGVYGIQRGLKNAGVGCMAISLWNVDDTATSLLMSRFHQNLYQGMSVHRAFMCARAYLMQMGNSHQKEISSKSFDPMTLSYQKMEEQKNYSLPQYCDAFIIVDAIE